MIDVDNTSFVEPNPWDSNEAHAEPRTMRRVDERMRLALTGTRASLTFTDKRIIALNV